ncbi:carbon-phosphorus lyase complex subunit PhnI [Georgenia alba]|uniref:Carbon-phosphorus lyase complex subunit PhnI n=1 Tax=Georgenia alba TaxID=2233858 RepID=A0ABW2Q6D2_9MICO
MTYAGGNRGGTAAILAAEALRARRLSEQSTDGTAVDVEAVRAAFPHILDRIMGEGGLWDEQLAAAAFIQGGGDTAEAVHLLRAHRSTLTRFAFSRPIDPDETVLDRRISSAHRKPDGPQLLGETVDYSPRLVRRPGHGDPLPPTDEILEVMAQAEAGENGAATAHPDETPRRYTRYLAANDLLLDRTDPTDPEPYDLALEPVRLPAPRSALLSAMAIAETGALVNIWYRSVLGPDGYSDESVTLGEVRHGHVPVSVEHPYTGNPVTIGDLRITECEAIDHLNERGEDPSRFTAGYGLALGHNERKAIAMANVDSALTRYRETAEGAALQQVVMLTTDGLAANGFLEHLKMPHYVTFRSMIERALAAADEHERGTSGVRGDGQSGPAADEHERGTSGVRGDGQSGPAADEHERGTSGVRGSAASGTAARAEQSEPAEQAQPEEANV